MTLVVAGPASSTTSTLSSEMSVYYDKVFLDRLVMEQVYNFLATKKALPKNAGKTISFTRQTAFTPKTTALTEGTNPTGTPFSSASVTASVAEYGRRIIAVLKSFLKTLGTLDIITATAV